MKSFKEFLTELFDSPVKWKWTSKSVNYWAAEFWVADKYLYVVTFDKNIKAWELVFVLDVIKEPGESDSLRERLPIGRTHNTGTGNQLQVFSTVLDIAQKFLKEVKPNILIFSGSKSSGKGDLYKMILVKLDNILKPMGYMWEVNPNSLVSDFFTIKKIVK